MTNVVSTFAGTSYFVSIIKTLLLTERHVNAVLVQIPLLRSSNGRKITLSGIYISMKPFLGIILSGLIIIWYSESVPEVTEFVTTI